MSKVNLDWAVGTATIDGKVYTFGELVDMAEANEAFRGTHLDEEALARFWRIAKDAQMLKDACDDDISEVWHSDPSSRAANGSVILVVPHMIWFAEEALAVFHKMCGSANEVGISGVATDRKMRISFSVWGVWTD